MIVKDSYIKSKYINGYLKSRNLTISEKEEFKNTIDDSNKEYIIKEIIDIEFNLDKFDENEKAIILRNCSRYIESIEDGKEIYIKLLTGIVEENRAEVEFNVKIENTCIKKDSDKSEIRIEKGNKNINLTECGSDLKVDFTNMGTLKNGQIFSENIVMNGSMGHGYAAELANDMYDNLTGKDAKIIGSDLKKNGADRLVDGVQIQTKYCKSGFKCISECFENGKFRYFNNDGTIMKIEVPYDKYEAAIESMKERIRNGEIPGVNNVNEARNIVKQGRFTYEQAKNVAKFGKIESITYDAVNGIKVMGTSMGISTIVTFACSVWNGEDIDVAFNEAIKAGMKIGGISWLNSIVTSQIGRTGIEKSLRLFTDYIVKKLDKNVMSNLANGLNNTGREVYGAAAANTLSKNLRGNIVSGAISTAIMSTIDINKLVKGDISGSQAFKNIAVSTTGAIGGGVGAVGGAALGATVGSVIPIVGTAVGATIGGILGGVSASTTVCNSSRKILDKHIEDDSKVMMRILTKEIEKIASDYLLNKNEIKLVVDKVLKNDLNKTLQLMFKAKSSENFAKDLVLKYTKEELKKRQYIKMN